MKFPHPRPATTLLAFLALLVGGPAGSAPTAPVASQEAAKTVAKTTVKAKAKAKAKTKAKTKAKAKARKMRAVIKAAPAAGKAMPATGGAAAVAAATPVLAAVLPVAAPAAAPASAPVAMASGNPYLPGSNAPLRPNPYLPGAAAPGVNPYLSTGVAHIVHAAVPVSYPAAAAPVAWTWQPVATPAAPLANPYLGKPAATASNPYLAAPAAAPAAAGSGQVVQGSAPVVATLRDWLPSLPTQGQSILPSIKKVYPTGEKPLVVVTFKCPTEVVGITPAPTKLLHEAVTGVMNLVNASNLLSFNLQQVCQ